MSRHPSTGTSWPSANGTTASSSIRRAVTLLLAVFCLVAPIKSLLGQGPFEWHIAQKEAWQGGLEVVFLMLAFFAALGLQSRRLRALLMLSCSWLYARRHGVDLSIALIWLYVEGMFALGWRLLPRVGLSRRALPERLLVAGLMGVVAWSLVIWGLSAIGGGSLTSIRLVAVAVLGTAILTRPGPSVATIVFRRMTHENVLARASTALIGGLFFALFAKSSVLFDYDSLWYGLQADEVLVGSGGLYHAQGLASVAHYYPKLYEALQLPFSGLQSVSLIFGLGIFSWAMIVFTALAILRELRVERVTRLVIAALVATLPAAANIAMTAKGDVFSAWMMLLAMLAVVKYAKEGGSVWFWMTLSALTLGVLSRLSNLPYVALITVCLAIVSVNRVAKRDGSVLFGLGLLGPGLRLGAATGVLATLVLARSVLLAGVAIVAPNAVVRLQQSLGLELKYPIGLLPPDDGLRRLPVFDGLWGFLFEPAAFPHLIITWTGNVWGFLPVAVLVLGGASARSRGRGAWLLLAVGLSFFAVLFGYKFLVPGGDGNYFITPLFCLLLWEGVLMSGLQGRSLSLLSWVLLVFALLSAAISFVTGSWGPGTRAWDANFTRLPFELSTHAARGLQASNLQGVAHFFAPMPPGTRVVGLETTNPDAGVPSGWWLPVQYEPLQPYAWQQPDLVRSSDSIEAYLQREQIKYVVVPAKEPDDPVAKTVLAALEHMKAEGAIALAYEDPYYSVWNAKQVARAQSVLADGGRASVSVAMEGICSGGGNNVARVTWASSSPAIAVKVKAPDAATPALWLEAGGSGAENTGPWIGRGAEFIFSRGRNGAELGRLRIDPECGTDH